MCGDFLGKKMSNFTKKFHKWRAMSLGSNSHSNGRGTKSPLAELLSLGSGTSQRWNSISSGWKPIWYTGWHAGVLACANSVVVVLIINISLTIYAATDPRYKMEGGIGTLYLGSCDKTKKIGMWLHLGINILSTLLLAGSNYTQQCLAAPTRSEIDAAHARRQWMDIGIPSVRNLLRIKRERALLWIAIGITSVPLHLLYNSAVYTSLTAHDFVVSIVTNNHFDPGAYSNITEELIGYYQEFYNIKNWTDRPEFVEEEIQLMSRVYKGYDTETQNYEDLTPSDCVKSYIIDFKSNRRNLFLITKHSSNSTHNNTLLGLADLSGIQGNSLPCPSDKFPILWELLSHQCSPTKLASDVARGLPWRMYLKSGEVEIGGCKSERTPEKCKVQFSLAIMIAIICCNFIKAFCMIITLSRSREPTLVTLGDAVDSFLRFPDPTTIEMCFADRQFVERKWRHGWKVGPREWKQKGVQRWWTSVSKTRWITCNFLCLITIIAAGVLLRMGMVSDGKYMSTDIKSMWARGFGKVNTVSVFDLSITNITQAILLANLPQTILSFLYLTYNSLFTGMLLGHEWSLFSHHHRTLRVTSPRPGQRSTYWLQIPYIYAIPLISLSGLLHWLISQSVFLSRVETLDPLGREILQTTSTVGYSCIAIIFALPLGILALLTAIGMGCRPFVAGITTVGSCSPAISAACHAWGEDSEAIVGRKVRWGDVGIVQNLGVRHLTFSSEEDVGKPISGEIYAGMGEDME